MSIKETSKDWAYRIVMARTWIIVLVTAFVIAIAKTLSIIAIFYFEKPAGESLQTYEKVIQSFITISTSTIIYVATAILTIAVVRFLIGLKDTRTYFQGIFHQSLADILEKKYDKKEFVDDLSDETVNKLHYELVKRSSGIEFKYDSSFFKTMRTKIEPLLGAIHYDWLKVEIDNKIVRGDTPHIISTRTLKMCYHTRTSDTYDLGFSQRILKQIEGIENTQLYRIDNLEIEGQKIDVTLREPSELENGELQYALPLHRDIEVADPEKGERIQVKREETLILPLDDSIRWTIAPDKSLRQITVHCTFNEPVHPTLWLFGIQREQEGSYDPQEPENKEDRCFIYEWKGWMLPSHGFIISWI